MRVHSLVILTLLSPALRAAEPDARAAAERGLKFLTEEAVAWKEDRKCASCHHLPMAVWALNEARRRGLAADDKARTELTAWALAEGDPAKVDPKQPARKDIVLNQTPLMLTLALEAADPKEQVARDGLKAMLALVLRDQAADGAWRLLFVWEPHNPTPDVTTGLALLALTSPAAPDLGEPGKAARERGLKWLADAKPADATQADAVRLLLLRRLGRPAADWEPILKGLLGRQNADGGWGQAAGEKSDAFATGQALYALGEAGKAGDPAVAKGRAFLASSQREDGSWPMESRAGGPSGKPARSLRPISFVGTAWAVLGLMNSAPSGDKAAPAK